MKNTKYFFFHFLAVFLMFVLVRKIAVTEMFISNKKKTPSIEVIITQNTDINAAKKAREEVIEEEDKAAEDKIKKKKRQKNTRSALFAVLAHLTR